MDILHIAPINMLEANGLRYSVPGLTSAQNKIEGVNAALLNINNYEKLKENEVSRFDFKFFGNYTEFESLEIPFNKPDIVVFHGVYFPEYVKISKKLQSIKIPYVVVPRVSLTLGAQKQKFLKKQIGNFFLFNRFIKNAAKIQYLTENEKELSKGFKKDSFVVGNGISLPSKVKDRISQNINITFIGRYDLNHKGLDILVGSIINIKKQLRYKRIKINFYGSDFREGKLYIQKMITDNNLYEVLEVNDAVFNENKDLVLLDTDIFIATSRFEGHPMAVIEAMSYGIPCILTSGTNMLDKLTKYDAGWSTKLDVNEIAKTILLAISDNNKILIKGFNARKLIEENYTWEKVAHEAFENYHKIVEEYKTNN